MLSPLGSRIDPTYSWEEEIFLLTLFAVTIVYTITGYAWLDVTILLFERRLKYISAIIATLAAILLVTMFGFTVSGLDNIGLNTHLIGAL